ncbi:hypothetical protein UY3_00314 [Chelonia mydas]|uniref:Uncharacterized protein n=1 Tax=Chelonia mydas TaxID=8469 RepID=M7BX50_CHEMY|nr:hypothetical protein UY3_00314 [Chelonia mydas]
MKHVRAGDKPFFVRGTRYGTIFQRRSDVWHGKVLLETGMMHRNRDLVKKGEIRPYEFLELLVLLSSPCHQRSGRWGCKLLLGSMAVRAAGLPRCSRLCGWLWMGGAAASPGALSDMLFDVNLCMVIELLIKYCINEIILVNSVYLTVSMPFRIGALLIGSGSLLTQNLRSPRCIQSECVPTQLLLAVTKQLLMTEPCCESKSKISDKVKKVRNTVATFREDFEENLRSLLADPDEQVAIHLKQNLQLQERWLFPRKSKKTVEPKAFYREEQD